MMKVLTLSVVLVSIVAIGLMVFRIDTDPEKPLPDAQVDLLTSEMDRLDAAWAVFDANTGAWVLQDDMRRELGRVELVDGRDY